MSEKPNSVAIEGQAVAIIKECMRKTGYVWPNVDDNDKTPSWDGALYLYKTRWSQNKDDLVGRIPVQVKGKWVDSYPTGKTKFSVDVSDLKNYRNDGGVLFFLVLMRDFDDYKIYCDTLLPFDLRDLIESAGEQSSKTIKLSAFNHKYHDGIVRRLTDFLEDREKQGQLLPNVRSIEDLSNFPLPIESIGFSVTSDSADVTQIENEMLSHPHYIYAKSQYLDVPFAVEKVEFDKLTRFQEVSVEVNGETLYHHIQVVRTLGKDEEIRFGGHLAFLQQDGATILRRDSGGTLKEYVRDLKLTIALAKRQPIKIGNQTLVTTDFHMDKDRFRILEQQLKEGEEILKTFQKLNVQKDLDISSLSETEWEFLKYLVDGVLFGKPVPLSMQGKTGAGKLTIGNITVALVSRKAPSQEGYYIQDYFENNFKDGALILSRGTPQEGKPASPYIILDSNNLSYIDNVDFHKLAQSVKQFAFFPLYGERITWLILDLLKMYDSSGNDTFINTANALLDYLQENEPDNDAYRINRIQIEKRRRELSKDELRYLRTLKADRISTQFQLAASILLESYQEAQLLYDELPDSERELFNEYPIMHLWKNSPISKLPLVSNNSA